ncbi:MAG: hypothetical protein HFF01_00820 [Erysipelotrichaceae bacterium]|nr:hypothetical protein [Erysipelotrichaceae bacterium]
MKIKEYILNHKINCLIIILILISLCSWGYWNLENNESFLKASMVDIVTIFLLLFVSYFLVESKNNMKKRQEIVSTILDEIVTSSYTLENLCSNEPLNNSLITIEIRKVKNNCDLLKQACTYFKIKEAVTYLKNEIDELDAYTSEQNKSIVSDATVQRHCKNLSYKCKEIYSKIYFES